MTRLTSRPSVLAPGTAPAAAPGETYMSSSTNATRIESFLMSRSWRKRTESQRERRASSSASFASRLVTNPPAPLPGQTRLETG